MNLNPSEPDRIIDPQLGQTDVGRILLQADLHLKESAVALIDPNTALGAQFWLQMNAAGLTSFCLRNWIVPAPATVRDTGDELYILDAPLQVKTDADYFQLPGTGSGKGPGCPANSSGASAIFRSLILPEMEKAVNQAPEYSDLRRVYLSRVAAEWYRERNFRQPTSVGYLINRNNIDPWVSKQPWKPKDIFDKYLSEINATTYTMSDGSTITTGGVDFSQPVSFNALSESNFLSKAPRLNHVVTQSMTSPATDTNGQSWLGASNVETLPSSPLSTGTLPSSPSLTDGDSWGLQILLAVTGVFLLLVLSAAIGVFLLIVSYLLWRRSARSRRPRWQNTLFLLLLAFSLVNANPAHIFSAPPAPAQTLTTAVDLCDEPGPPPISFENTYNMTGRPSGGNPITSLADLKAALGAQGWSSAKIDALMKQLVDSGMSEADINQFIQALQNTTLSNDQILNFFTKHPGDISGIWKDYQAAQGVPNISTVLRDMATESRTNFTGSRYQLSWVADWVRTHPNGPAIDLVEDTVKGQKAADVVLKDGTVIELRNYDWSVLNKGLPFRNVTTEADSIATQIARYKDLYSGQKIVYYFNSTIGAVPEQIQQLLNSEGVGIAYWPPLA